jgi:hypothetical protein
VSRDGPVELLLYAVLYFPSSEPGEGRSAVRKDLADSIDARKFGFDHLAKISQGCSSYTVGICIRVRESEPPGSLGCDLPTLRDTLWNCTAALLHCCTAALHYAVPTARFNAGEMLFALG